MKIILPFLTVILLLGSCARKKTELHAVGNIKGKVYGDSIKASNIIESSAVLIALKDAEKKDMQIKGKVEEVCQKEGCWIIMKLANDETMRVTFDHNFKVDKDLKGKEIVMKGFAYTDTLSIEDQRHYAEDAGTAPAEIAKITTPKKQVSFLATGVVIL